MLFLYSIKTPKKQTIKLNKTRKEKDSFLALYRKVKTSIITSNLQCRVPPKLCLKRASVRTFESRKRGSLTVEASIAIPIFFFTLVCVIYLMEMLAVQMNVRIGMHNALETLAYEVSTSSYISTNEIEEIIVSSIGEEKLDQSRIVNGSEGLECSASNISMITGLITLRVSYKVELPLPIFEEFGMVYSEEMIGKGWTGYESTVAVSATETVYVTESASVYHLYRDCTHLTLNITMIEIAQLDELRNEYGGIYTACSKCVEEGTTIETAYIASAGSYYHSTLSCSGLTRTIYAIPISEAIGMGVCSRCAAR